MWSQDVSPAGLDLIKTFEGFRAEPEALRAGGWVVGHGHVRLAEAGAPVTETDASELLKRDLAPHARFVSSKIVVQLTQSQFDALVSFCLSVGQGAFEKSDVLRKVNSGDMVGAACAMDAWRKSSASGESEIHDVLIQRRAAEKAFFLKDAPVAAAPSVLVRAELDYAVAILAAPRPTSVLAAAQPVVARRSDARVITDILKSDPSTALVLTRIATAEEEEAELVTAHARPAARKVKRAGKIGEKAGLAALFLAGAAACAAAGMTMLGGDATDLLAGASMAAPGIGAAIAAGYFLVRKPAAARAA